jgi:NADPH:quinone reductase-like Zn-dependent oxidoreductase/short-subunit dehydrogenase/acyl carrier protein
MKPIINLQDHSFIQDHRLNQRTIIPATWYLEALVSHDLKTYGFPISLSNLHYHKAINMKPNTDYSFDIRSDDGMSVLTISINQEWEVCASGCIQKTQTIPENTFNIQSILSRCLKSYNKEAYYQSLSLLHYDFGPLHQGVEELHLGTNEAIGKINFLPGLERNRYTIHPAFLDACSHVGLSLLDGVGEDYVFITTSQDRVTLFHPFPDQIWCHAKKVHQTSDSLSLDLMIYDDHTNQLLAEIKGYQLQRIALSTLETKDELSAYYQIIWEEKSLPITQNTNHTLQKIILDQSSAIPKITDPSSTALIIFLNSEDPIYENNLNSLLQLLTISQALHHQQIVQLNRLIVVLHQEASLSRRQENIRLHNACVPSFCRTMKQEFPGWHVACIDVGSRTKKEALVLLDQELSQPYEDNDITYSAANRYVMRLRTLNLQQTRMPDHYKLSFTKGTTLQETHWIPSERTSLLEHDVEIKVAASSLNFRDILILLNRYPEKDAQLGIDGSGIISSVGPGVKSLKPGDEVIFIGQHNFSNIVTLPECNVVKKPSHFHLTAAAGLPVVFITAFYALINIGKLKKNQSILIHSAAGGVGTAAILIAKQMGATIHATAHPSKWSSLYALGVSTCHSSRELNFSEEITPNSIDLILNNLIGEYIPRSLTLLKENGTFIEIGNKEIWSKEEMRAARPDVNYEHLHVLHEQEKNPKTFHHVLLKMCQFIEQHHLTVPSLKVFPAEDIQLAIRDMVNAKHLGKLVISHEHPQISCIQQKACYLITGGLGGIGMAVMHYLLEQGAARVYLMGRHIPTNAPQDKRVVILTGDVASETDVLRVLDEINHSPYPLKGIFHAAGISDDNVIPNLNEDQIRRVLQAKHLGALYLHQHTQSINLDHFVLFSSITSLLGTPGLANYAAANGFLNQLAYYRHFVGLPALSILWGPWEVGMLQKRDSKVRQHWLNQGFSIMDTKTALHHFEQALKSKKYQMSIMQVNWDTLLSFYEKDQIPSLFLSVSEHIRHNTTQQKPDSEFVNSLQSLTDPEKTEKLIHYLQEEVKNLTGDKVNNPSLSFTELGITSLTAIEMTQRIENTLGLTLPQTLLFNYTRIPTLADYLLIDKLQLKAKPVTHEKKTEVAEKDTTQLTDKEVMNLLDNALKDIDDLLN